MTPYGKLRAAMAQCEQTVLATLRRPGGVYVDPDSGYTWSPALMGALTLKPYLRGKWDVSERNRRCLSIATRFYQRWLRRANAAEDAERGNPSRYDWPGSPKPVPTYV
jgi:hypothetical protein